MRLLTPDSYLVSVSVYVLYTDKLFTSYHHNSRGGRHRRWRAQVVPIDGAECQLTQPSRRNWPSLESRTRFAR